jgi:ribosomal protein S18 acetylase RimI-like enzyme
MDDDPFAGAQQAGRTASYAESFGKWDLLPVELSHQPLLNRYLRCLPQPLSDYTFSQIFTWRNSLRLLWREIDDHLCIFANGSGDLTLLIPPIAPDSTGADAVLRRAFELMDDYNVAHGVPDRSRVEYVSQPLLDRLDQRGLVPHPMGHDYVYETTRMIELAGGDLKSKRQERNRFTRDNRFHCETYDLSRHLEPCLRLLGDWKIHQDAHNLEEPNLNSIKRHKEARATELALRHANQLALTGMVVYVEDELRAFTLGEPLGDDQASIVIEKTDLAIKGLAQFIFSEFCRVHWSHLPLINAGDDWGLETLAWTKASYRPTKLLKKFVLNREAKAMVNSGFTPETPIEAVVASPKAEAESPAFEIAPAPLAASEPANADEVIVRPASVSDVESAMGLETSCFDTYCISRRQLRYLQACPNAVFLVAERDDRIVGEGIALIRHHKRRLTGRLYSLAVHPEHRGQGIGNRILQMMLAELVARGAKRVFLEVEQVNQSALKLYERHGFRTIGQLPNYYGEGRHGVHMVCDLIVPTPLQVKSAA